MENQVPEEQTAPVEDPAPDERTHALLRPDALETLVAAAGASGDVDKEKLDRMRAALAKFKERNAGETTISGSEAVSDAPKGFTGAGSDVDWSEYDLDYTVRHLYPTAQYRETPQGPKWVAMVDEFVSTERDYRNYDKRVAGRNGGEEPLNLGQYLNDMLNSPEDWKLVSLLPGSSGRAGLLLQRKVPMILPDPVPLKKETEVAAPSDPELERLEKTVADFMEDEDLTPPSEVEDTLSEPPSRESLLVQQALEINEPTLRTPPPLGAGIPRADHSEIATQIGREAAAVDLASLPELPSEE